MENIVSAFMDAAREATEVAVSGKTAKEAAEKINEMLAAFIKSDDFTKTVRKAIKAELEFMVEGVMEDDDFRRALSQIMIRILEEKL